MATSLLKLNGVVKDTDPLDVAPEFYTDAENMRFESGRANKFGGEELATTTTDQAEHLLFNGNHNLPLWYYMGDGLIRSTNFTDDLDLDTGNNVTSGVDWDATLFNLIPVMNNTVDVPWISFPQGAQVSALPAFDPTWRCEAIRPFRSFLVALNITDGGTTDPNRLIWSDSSDAGALPASWDIADPTTLAGDAYLTSTKGEILDGLQLRDLFVIYKTHSTYIMQLVSDQSVMRVQRVQLESGILAKNCVTEFKGNHFVVSDGDVVLFDGQNIESIAEDRVRVEIFNNIDTTYYANTYVVRYDRFNEIWVCYPELGQQYASRAAVWNWRDDTWTFRNIEGARHIQSGLANFNASDTWAAALYTWASATYTWRPVSSNPTTDTLIKATTGQLNVIDQTNDLTTGPQTSKLEKQSLDFDKPEQIKLVSKLIPKITANAGTRIYIRIGSQMDPDDQIMWEAEQLYTVGTDREVSTFAKGRFISFRMRTQDADTTWSTHGIQFVYREAGRF